MDFNLNPVIHQNNRINEMNNEILNRNPIQVLIPGPHGESNIHVHENNHVFNVPYIFQDNWINYFSQDPNNNNFTIRINYEYVILHMNREIDEKTTLLNHLHAVHAEEIDDGLILINNIMDDIEDMRLRITEIGDIYLNILNQNQD